MKILFMKKLIKIKIKQNFVFSLKIVGLIMVMLFLNIILELVQHIQI